MQEFYAWILTRDLERLTNEIQHFKSETNLWVNPGAVSNSAGNLVLHLVGNLNHFIGAILGETGYVREREKEFSEKNVPKEKLMELVESTRKMIESVIPSLNDERLQMEMSVKLSDQRTYSGQEFIVHLSGHLNYHLGQINYLRRIIEG